MIRKKTEYFKFFKQGFITRASNNAFRNKVNISISKAKREYCVNTFDNHKKDAKKTWRLIRGLCGINDDSGPSLSKLISNSNNPSDVVNKFNEFFTSIGSTLDAELETISSHDTPVRSSPNPKSMYFFNVSQSEVLNLISNLKLVKSGINEMPVRIFKQLANYFIIPLTKIINLSIQSGIFPSLLKLARIVPIHKKGDYENPSNFRPISCLHYLSKLFEKCVKNRLISLCVKYDIFSKQQFGFREKLSTLDALLNLTETIYDSLDDKKHHVVLTVDLKKAFDVINHSILFKKLEHYGIRGLPLLWFKNFLSDRKSYVVINSVKSSLKTIDIGVPQGSTLGPILFLLYINDLPSISNIFKMTLFADDTTLSASNTDYDQLINDCNNELIKFREWTIINRLTCNSDKTELLFMSNRYHGSDEHRIFLGNENVTTTSSSKFLGVFIDSNLSFNHHIKSLIGKISRHTGILYKIRNQLSSDAIMKYYFAFIYPYLSYNIEIWGGSCDSILNPLIIQHKRLIRTMTWSRGRDHTNPLFSKLGILKLKDIFIYRLNILMFKRYSAGEFAVGHERMSRFRNLAQPKFHRLTQTQRAFSYAGPIAWNNLPSNLREIDSFVLFKRALRQYLLEKYESQ